MALPSVIRRWAFRDGMPIREIARRTGLSQNRIRKDLRADTVEPRFQLRDRPSKLDPFAGKLSGWLVSEAGKSRNSGAPQSRCTPTSSRWATTAPTTALPHSCGHGRPSVSAKPRPVGAAHSCRWLSPPARRSSSTGARTGRCWVVSAPSCRTIGHSSCAPICCRPTRCCSMPIITPSACWAACPGVGSTTICEPPWTGWVRARHDRTPASPPWRATICSTWSSAIRLPVGRRDRSTQLL